MSGTSSRGSPRLLVGDWSKWKLEHSNKNSVWTNLLYAETPRSWLVKSKTKTKLQQSVWTGPGSRVSRDFSWVIGQTENWNEVLYKNSKWMESNPRVNRDSNWESSQSANLDEATETRFERNKVHWHAETPRGWLVKVKTRTKMKKTGFARSKLHGY